MNAYQKIQCFEKTYQEYRDLLGQDVSEEELLPLIKEQYPNDQSLVQWWHDNHVKLPKSPFAPMRHNGLLD